MRSEVRISRILMGRLEKGDDLLEALTAIVRAEGVRLARLEALGAVQVARLAFYNQRMHTYDIYDVSGPHEILSLAGNVSLKDGEPMIHAHLTLGDASGRAFGGHLAPGTRVFACEYVLHVFEGAEFHRAADESTGLPLWKA